MGKNVGQVDIKLLYDIKVYKFVSLRNLLNLFEKRITKFENRLKDQARVKLINVNSAPKRGFICRKYDICSE